MKKDDIKVGMIYAASRDKDWRRWGSVVKVEVTGPPEYRETETGRPVGPWVVPVTYPDGEPTRMLIGGPRLHTLYIKEPWTDYEAALAKVDEDQATAERNAAEARGQRLLKAYDLAERLTAAGVESSSAFLDRGRDQVSYVLAGFEVMPVNNPGDARLTAPLADALVRYVEHGESVKAAIEEWSQLAEAAARWKAQCSINEDQS